MNTKSFTPLGGGPTAAGKLTRIPFMWVWLKLTIIKLASRKNMMSINGMISMRARLCGTGEDSLIAQIGRISIRGARHREGNGNAHLGNGPRPKSPLPERTEGGLIQYRVTNTLLHGSSADVAARCINRHDTNSAARDAPRTRLVRILGTGRVYSEGFRSGHRHRLGFDWREFLLRRWWWPWRRCSFFVELWLHFGRRRWFGQRNIFWRRGGLRWRQRRLDNRCCRRRNIYRRRLALLSKCNRGEVNRYCTTQRQPRMPTRGWLKK